MALHVSRCAHVHPLGFLSSIMSNSDVCRQHLRQWQRDYFFVLACVVCLGLFVYLLICAAQYSNVR